MRIRVSHLTYLEIVFIEREAARKRGDVVHSDEVSVRAENLDGLSTSYDVSVTIIDQSAHPFEPSVAERRVRSDFASCRRIDPHDLAIACHHQKHVGITRIGHEIVTERVVGCGYFVTFDESRHRVGDDGSGRPR